MIMWRDNGIYFLFDPHPRDTAGNVFGKDEWTQLEPETYPEETYEEEEPSDEEGEGGEEVEDEEKQPDEPAATELNMMDEL